MNYLVAVLPDRQKTEEAYNSLKNQDLKMAQISVLGEGYQNADQFGLINPNRQASLRSNKMAYFSIPFGFAAGYAFNWLTGINVVGGLSPIANHIIGGVFGMAAGALGALLVGGLVGWTTSSGDAIAYRNRLNDGKYLIIAKGSDSLVRQATRILRQFNPEEIQGYSTQE